MSLNTNFSNHANPCAISFQAAFKTEIPVKDAERLLNIKKLFAQKTQHYNSDTLTLTRSKDPCFSEYPILTITDEIFAGDYKYAHIVDNFDELMQSMTDRQIVKKLINYFKIMKKEAEYDNYVKKTDNILENLKRKIKAYKQGAENCAESGDEVFASRYRTIAQSIQGRINSISAEKQQKTSKILSVIDKIAENEPDLDHVSGCLREIG